MLACALVGGAGCRQLLGLDDGVVAAHDASPMIDAPDAPPMLAHDEDSDNIDDSQDNCPATPNPDQAASETVGAACDPRPELGDSILFFLSFHPAGQPMQFQPNSAVTFADDYAELNNDELRTMNQIPAYRVSTHVTLVTFASLNASFELSVGNRACRVEQCGGLACITANDGTTTTTAMIDSMATDATVMLTQEPMQLVCTVVHMGSAPDTATLPTNGLLGDRLRIRSDKATIRVNNVTVFVVSP